MKNLIKHNILISEEVKDAIALHPYITSQENNFSVTFSDPEKVEIDPFEGIESSRRYYDMTAEMDVTGWICVGEIIERLK